MRLVFTFSGAMVKLLFTVLGLVLGVRLRVRVKMMVRVRVRVGVGLLFLEHYCLQ